MEQTNPPHDPPQPMRRALLSLFSICLLNACLGHTQGPSPVPSADTEPYVLVLGTAQDGGLPQIGCRQECCRRVRADSTGRRLVTSLLLVDPASGQRWLFDASPDLPEQVERARGHGDSGEEKGGVRPALFDGIFLTHAHVGHYTGLLHLGREAYGSAAVPLFATGRMLTFLGENGPWSLILGDGYLVPREIVPDQALQLAPGLSVTPIAVPHREEFSDTVAFLIRGPKRALLYVPDIDKWERWDHEVEDIIGEVDFALLDGTFFGDGEIPGREMSSIPHPFIHESLRRFRVLAPSERAKIYFTHLNHTNRAAIEAGAEHLEIEGAGMAVLQELEVFDL